MIAPNVMSEIGHARMAPATTPTYPFCRRANVFSNQRKKPFFSP